MRRPGFSTWRNVNLALAVAIPVAQGFTPAIPVAQGFSPALAVAQGFSPARPDRGLAYAIVNLQTGATIASANPRALDVAIAPGSTMKMAALVALLESSTIAPGTRIACTRKATIAGRSYPCTHPDLHRPLTPAEALAHSCNSYFAAACDRLPRRALDAACVSLGLAPPASRVETALVALGVDGVTATPRQMLEVLHRLTAHDSRLAIGEATRRTVIAGLRGASSFGTASALAAGGIDALAKTGSAGGANPHGLVVAVTPPDRPTRGIVVLVAGGSGRDAVAIAAERLRDVPGVKPEPTSDVPGLKTRPTSVRVGFARETDSEVDQVFTNARGAPPPLAAPRAFALGAAAGARPGTAGSIRVGFARAGGGYDVQTLEFEDYVARVIAGEAAVRSPDAALDALAIAVRTFAAANPGRHGREGFDVCDLTHCQVVRAATDATERSVDRTRGRVLRYRGAPASVYYTASCGGRSELASAVWPGHTDPPFLPSRSDPPCAGAPGWTADISAPDLLRALRAAGFSGGSLRDLRIVTRTGSGRAGAIQLAGLTPPTISGQDLRVATGRTLGWNLIKSTAFDVTRTATGYRFTGKGSGHGVGLCVLGSVRMALDGASAETILATYFPGITTNRAGTAASPLPPAPANVKVWLSNAEEPLRGMVENLAQHLWIGVAGRAAAPRIGSATLRFHPTTESYRRATGQPWWVAATTSGAEAQLLPVAVLRDRGVLAQTIAHEIAHIVTGPALDGRPLWVREGAAIYFAGEKYGSPSAKLTCPDDSELARSTSAGALRDAYARAAACFAKRVEAGEDWKSIR